MNRHLSLHVGNLVEVLGTATGTLILFTALSSSIPSVLRGAGLILSWGFLWFFPHCLTHYVVGTLVGISFNRYLVAPSAVARADIPVVSDLARHLPAFAIITNKPSMERASREAKAVMYASGAITSMTLPLLVAILAVTRVGDLLSYALIVASLVNIGFTLTFSPKTGDFMRARRSLST